VPLIIPVVVIIAIYLLSSIKILAEYERGVIFRLGRARELSSFSLRWTAWCASICAR
jgi:regulator of protease activity HflC (stomatin/prohibitin superfamily)